MLSRLASKAALLPSSRPVLVRFAGTAATDKKPAGKPDDYIDLWENPQRDYVNFPTARPKEFAPPVRHVWVPESYFKLFYPKTGVTGPYIFTAGALTFLWSKEWWVLEHEFFAGIEFFVVFGLLVKYVGPQVAEFLDKENDAYIAKIRALRTDEIEKRKQSIADEHQAQFTASSFEELMQAKKEAVGLQLEAEYRSRLQQAHSQVKKRLDYQLELTNVMRRVEQKHMVDWIISNVRKSITAKQEDDALKKCVSDLKALAK